MYKSIPNIVTFDGQLQRAKFFTNNCSVTLNKEVINSASETFRQVKKIIGPIIQSARKDKKSYRDEVTSKNKDLKRRILRKIVHKLASLKDFGLTLDEIKHNHPFPKDSISDNKSLEFIRSAKLGDVSNLSRLIESNRYLVYEFDTVSYIDKDRQDSIDVVIETRPVTGHRIAATPRI